MTKVIGIWMYIRSCIRYHWAGVVVSTAVSLVIALPPVVFHFSPEYRGVDMIKTNTEAHYIAQINEVYDRHYALGNPYLADVKDAPYLFPPLGPHIIAGIGRVLHVSAVHAVMITRFLFSFGSAFILYLFVFHASKRRLIALVVPPCVMLAYNLLDPQSWKGVFEGYVHWPNIGFSGYGRPINSQVSSFFYFSYLYFFWKYVEEKSNGWYGVISALLLGLSFYVYLFTWTFIYSLNFILLIAYGFTKQHEKATKVLWLSLGAALVGIPYAIHMHAIMTHPWYAESAPRFGFVTSHAWNLSRVVLGANALFLISWWLFSQQMRVFWSAFFVTAFVVTNEQVLTGKYIFNHHYHWYYNTPLVIIFLVVWFFSIMRRINHRRAVPVLAAGAIIVVAFGSGMLRQYRAYVTALPTVLSEQRYAPLFEWLNQETPKDSVVLANVALSDMIPSFTHNNVYAAASSMVTLLPNERLMDAYVLYTYLKGVDKEKVAEYFEINRNDISSSIFDYQYRFQPGICLGCFPDEVLTTMTQKYQSLSDDVFLTFLRKHPIDYLVVDGQKDAEWKVVKRLNLPVLKTFGDVMVYDLRTVSSPR